jgi:hypothetical protein
MQLNEWKEVLVSKVLDNHKNGVEVAEAVYHCRSMGMDYAAINAVFAQKGISPVSKSWLSRHATVWDVWHNYARMSKEQMADVGVGKLYLISGVKEEDRDSWYHQAKVLTEEELKAALKEDGAEGADHPVTIHVSKRVYEMLQDAAVRIYNIAGYTPNQRSLEPFLEFVSVMAADGDGVSLKRIWNLVHGETKDDGVSVISLLQGGREETSTESEMYDQPF